ncbi:MAG: Crp/Fnr family transcriptional regulator [Clostridiales bacterium]|nr:Crp/Fnr family transcriptional regulator [Clostridiales bacterium]
MKHTFHFPTDGCVTCGDKLCTKKVSLFSNLNDEQIHTLLELIERKHYKKGEVVMHTGDDFDRLYIVNHGSLKASTYNEDGKEQILYILNDGDSLGELSLLKKVASPYDLIALKECFLCTIPKYRFDEFIKENPEIVFAILESAHEKISSLEKLVGAIASNDADIRLRFLIHRLMKQSGSTTPKGILISLQLTREDMANFVGVTRETISRKLSHLSGEGILEILENKQLLIVDQDYFEI